MKNIGAGSGRGRAVSAELCVTIGVLQAPGHQPGLVKALFQFRS